MAALLITVEHHHIADPEIGQIVIRIVMDTECGLRDASAVIFFQVVDGHAVEQTAGRALLLIGRVP